MWIGYKSHKAAVGKAQREKVERNTIKKKTEEKKNL